MLYSVGPMLNDNEVALDDYDIISLETLPFSRPIEERNSIGWCRELLLSRASGSVTID